MKNGIKKTIFLTLFIIANAIANEHYTTKIQTYRYEITNLNSIYDKCEARLESETILNTAWKYKELSHFFEKSTCESFQTTLFDEHHTKQTQHKIESAKRLLSSYEENNLYFISSK
ncbi:MAG: hypothetical protein LBL65_04845 [Campylobacteraceae bacterium]|jgi:hypothetical protein|nr:hypothetical protein [Campylobacteraceae bacterium]